MRSGVAFMIVLAFAAGGCRESDSEKAKKERAAIEKRITDSFALVPYRGVKTMLRSSVGNRPPELEKLATEMAEANARFNAHITAGTVPFGPTLELMVDAYRARALLKKYDEDTFPLLWDVFSKIPLPIAYYDKSTEHLVLGVTWIVLSLADRTGRMPAPEILFYELSRVQASPAWPWALRVLGRTMRGIAQSNAGYHYAAEEEFDGLIVDVEKGTPTDRAVLAYGQIDGVVDAELRATAHMLRAWNRFGLDRRDKAADDIEEALTQLQKIGVDNELTQWGWAIIHVRRKRYEEAGQSLDKLAASPHLDKVAQDEVKQAAVDVRKAGHDVFPLTSLRANYFIANALILRAGGIEHILDVLLGPELSTKAKAPVNWLRAVQHSIGDLLDEKQLEKAGDKVKAGGKQLLDSAGDLGKSGLDKAKGVFDKIKK